MECGLDCCEESYSGLGVDGGRAMLERVGATVTVLADWRGRRPHSWDRLDGTGLGLEGEEKNPFQAKKYHNHDISKHVEQVIYDH